MRYPVSASAFSCHLYYQALGIKKIMQKYGHSATVETVKLVTESENEVLTVNNEIYRIYYKKYTPDSQELDGMNLYYSS